MYGVTPRYATIALIVLQVLKLRNIFADLGIMYGLTPHHAPIALLLRLRGKTHHRNLDYLKSFQSIKHRNLRYINEETL